MMSFNDQSWYCHPERAKRPRPREAIAPDMPGACQQCPGDCQWSKDLRARDDKTFTTVPVKLYHRIQTKSYALSLPSKVREFCF